MAVGYKIYLHTNTDQPERHKYEMKSIRKTSRKNITYKAEHRLDSNKGIKGLGDKGIWDR
jgi:hypothetical protein